MVKDEKMPLVDESWWASVLQEDERQPPVDAAPRESRPAVNPVDRAADWEKAQTLLETEELVELEVTGSNRGGLVVRFNTIEGFVPASHLLDVPAADSEEARRGALARKVGQRLRLKVIEYDPAKERVVFSERAALAGPGSRQQVLERLKPGDMVTGAITNICAFGAFVDLGGVEGLIHVSELSWRRIAHPREVVQCNQQVQAMVISIDPGQGRVALSLKRLSPDPWVTVDQRYTVGQTVDGVVTNVVNFGAFVCLEEGLEGLIHASELADGHFLHPRSVVQEGEQVRVRVLNVDGANRRLGLSLRQVGGA